MNTRRLSASLLTFVAALVLASALTACGDDKSKTVKVTSAPSKVPTGLTTYKAEKWGFSLRYDTTAYELQSTEGSSSLALGPSLFTGKPLQLSDLSGVTVNLLATPADKGAATPTVSVTAQRLPFSVGNIGEGLSSWLRDDLLEQIDTVWGNVLTDEPRETAIGGGASAWTFEAVGFDEAAGTELHLRASVAAYGGYVYTVRTSAPRGQWDQIGPQLAVVADSFTIEAKTADPGPEPKERPYNDDHYGFSLTVPRGMVNAGQGSQPTADLLFGVQWVDVQSTPSIALSVGVSAAPEGIGNSQSGLLQKFYRGAADQLRGQAGVVSVTEPRAVDLGGDTAWLLDVTRRLSDGRQLRTRTYDVWHNNYVYSVSARGRADQWGTDWQLLEPAVLSFRAG